MPDSGSGPLLPVTKTNLVPHSVPGNSSKGQVKEALKDVTFGSVSVRVTGH